MTQLLSKTFLPDKNHACISTRTSALQTLKTKLALFSTKFRLINHHQMFYEVSIFELMCKAESSYQKSLCYISKLLLLLYLATSPNPSEYKQSEDKHPRLHMQTSYGCFNLLASLYIIKHLSTNLAMNSDGENFARIA